MTFTTVAETFKEFVEQTGSDNLPLPGALAESFWAKRELIWPEDAQKCADPSELWIFGDGSKAIVDNPRGVAFDTIVTVLP